jgi:galactokinase
MEHSIQQLQQVFREQFNQSPRLFFSPGRINLIGEHVDYNNGFVMPAAIDRGIYFAIAENNSGRLRAYSLDMQEMLDIKLEDIRKTTGWQNYLLGVIDQFQQKGLPLGGVNIVFGGNLPVGAGLSSSAAVECGLAFALNSLFGLSLSRTDMALLAQKAEHSFPGVQCGIMDQFANMMGRKDHVLLLDCNSLQYEALPLQLKEHVIMLINSKVHHSLATGEYNIRRQQCENGLDLLSHYYPGVHSFRDVTLRQVLQLEAHLDIDVYRRCLYVVEEIQRTQTAATFLQQHHLHEFGQLMFATQEGLSKLYDVSCRELDFLVSEARKYPEIIGARLMGGGFGGCTINIIEQDSAAEVSEKIAAAYQKTFGIVPDIYFMQTANGTHELVEEKAAL